ncbi:MAG: hypothetical protein IJU91_07415 [Selenomonadaceae bacterium]|nr:hypothetical protein [Selenomonadaceae bacterium]
MAEYIFGGEYIQNSCDAIDKAISRGIGRRCGLTYCRELIFSTTAKDEDVISVMRIDAQKLRSHFYGTVKYTAQEVLDDVIDIEKIFDGDKSEHWFKVELIDINAENEVLLDVA